MPGGDATLQSMGCGLRAALVRGDDGPLREFYAAAGRLIRERTAEWETIISDGPLAQATRAGNLWVRWREASPTTSHLRP